MNKENIIKSYGTLLKMSLTDASKTIEASSNDGKVSITIKGPANYHQQYDVYNASNVAKQILKDYNYANEGGHYFIDANEIAQSIVIENLTIEEGGK